MLVNEIKHTITFKELSELYDIRSKLAHTGTDKKFNYEKLSKLKVITRKTILWYLQNEKNSEVKDIVFYKLGIK